MCVRVCSSIDLEIDTPVLDGVTPCTSMVAVKEAAYSSLNRNRPERLLVCRGGLYHCASRCVLGI